MYELVKPLLQRPRAEPADGSRAGAGEASTGVFAADDQHILKTLPMLLKAPGGAVWKGPGTPLSASVQAGSIPLVRAFLKARVNVNQCDSKGVSPLHLAVFDGDADVARVLLQSRAEVDCCDCHGQTPLFFAPSRDVCKVLCEYKSDVTTLNRKGQSALHFAGRSGLHDVVSWLSLRVSRSLTDLRDVHGVTAKEYLEDDLQREPQSSSQAVSAPGPAPLQEAPTPLRGRGSPGPLQRSSAPEPGGGAGPPSRVGGGSRAPRVLAPESRERDRALTPGVPGRALDARGPPR